MFISCGAIIYFKGNNDSYALRANTAESITLEIAKWEPDNYTWTQSSSNGNGKISYTIRVPAVNTDYIINDGERSMDSKSDGEGHVKFEIKPGNKTITVIRK